MDDFLQLSLGLATLGTNIELPPQPSRPTASDLKDLSLFEAEIEPYSSLTYVYKSIPENRALHIASDKLVLMDLPVLRCKYAPTGFLKNGEFDTTDRSFWYLKRPDGVDAMIAVAESRRDFYIGLRTSLEECPTTIAEANEILEQLKLSAGE